MGSQAARERGLYRTDTLLRELDRGRGGDVVNHPELFRAANLEMWLTMLASRGVDTRRANAGRMAESVQVVPDRQPLVRANRNALPE